MLKTSIPFVDLRDKTPVDLLRAYPDKAHALVNAARRTYGVFSRAASAVAMPLADRVSHKWLKRARNPYLHDIESFADILEVRGIYALNVSYEWGCTSGVYRTGETVSMLRILDWPFPALGQHVVVALQSGKAGEFYNVTWPAVSGVFTAMAPGRFAGALNQAPMRRHGRSFAGDWLKNRRMLKNSISLPPAHLLRQAFEQAESYEKARDMLARTPVALPVIYVLSGPKAGQGCIIERLENESVVSDLAAGQGLSISNHFTSRLADVGQGWRAREIDSDGRLRQSRAIHGHELRAADFNWLQAPMLNARTRLAVVADAATGRLAVQGFEGLVQATEVFSLPGDASGQRQPDQMFA